MSDEPWTDMKIDLVKFERNNAEVPLEYQEQFRGQHIAWNAEGTHVVASADEYEDLHAKLREMGIPLDEVVFGHVDKYDAQF